MSLSLFISPYLRSILHSLSMAGNLVGLWISMIVTCLKCSILRDVSERRIPSWTLFIRCCKNKCFW